MPVHYQYFLPLLSLFLNRVDLIDFYPITINAKVVKVYDGDTLKLQTETGQNLKLRISKIDAPELTQKFWNSQKSAGMVATQCLKSVLHKPITLWLIEGRDRYGRILGDSKSEVKLSLKLVQAGCASLYPYARYDSWKEKHQFVDAFLKSLNRRQGLWKWGLIRRPHIYRRDQNARRKPVEAE
jgi:micrococcal nuclease